MSAVAQSSRGLTAWLSRLIPTERGMTQALVSAGVIGLICSIIFPLHIQDRLPYNVLPSLPLAFFMIVACVALRGRAVLRITAFDWIMVTWIGLTILSQMHAWLFLHRNMYEHEVVNVNFVLLNMWFIFRAFFAFTIVDPQTAAKATIRGLIIVISICTIIGILQSTGPIQKQMVDLAYRIGVGETAIKLGAAGSGFSPRTTSVFSGPGIFGFVNMVGASLVIGWAMAYRNKLKEIQGVAVIGALAFFAYANLNSQSRMTFVLAALLAIYFLIYLIRAAKWRALLTAAIMFVTLAGIVVLVTSQGNYEYMTSIFKTGIQQDASYLARTGSLQRFAEVAGDIPFIGVGQDYYSLVMYGRGDFYSNANGTGDNNLAMAYFLMGIPGVIHFFFLNYVAIQALRRLKTENRVFITSLKNGASLILALYLINIPFSIRYHKIETFVYFLMIFGVVFGLIAVQQVRNRRLRELGLVPEDLFEVENDKPKLEQYN